MAAVVGQEPVMHYRDLAFMGFVEVLANLRTILGFFRKAKEDIAYFKPDRVVLIDYPGFNLRLAKWLYKHGIPVTYYITPQVWAWHSSRIKQLKQFCDQLLVILPFEESWFADHGAKATYVGHPLIDAIRTYQYQEDFTQKHELDSDYVAVLPGSRTQEIQLLLPVMIEAARSTHRQIVVSKVPHQPASVYQQAEGDPTIEFIEGQAYDILRSAKVALVASGTATLETALHKVPQIVCYKGSEINFQIGKRLISLDYISLVNLILEEEVVPELIQHDCTADNISRALVRLQADCPRAKMTTSYERLWSMLDRNASQTAADRILDLL